MITGVETAGPALATLGLVMSGLSGLINGLDAMSAVRCSRYRLILERVARDMNGQQLNLRDIPQIYSREPCRIWKLID